MTTSGKEGIMLRLGMATILGVSALAAAVACTNSADLGGTVPPNPEAGQNEPDTGAVTQNLCTPLTAEPACEAAVDVATADEIAAIISALTEVKFTATTSDSGATLKPTRDIRVTAAIELDAQRFGGSGDLCAGQPPGNCTTTWAFSGEKTAAWNYPVSGGTPARPLPPGVICSDATCAKIAIAAGTVVRFQRVFEPLVQNSKNQHFIRVVRTCATACDADELQCTPSATCVKAKAFCTLCDGQQNSVCACRDGCTALAEGKQCQYVAEDDLGGSGTCQAGNCSR